MVRLWFGSTKRKPRNIYVGHNIRLQKKKKKSFEDPEIERKKKKKCCTPPRSAAVPAGTQSERRQGKVSPFGAVTVEAVEAAEAVAVEAAEAVAAEAAR